MTTTIQISDELWLRLNQMKKKGVKWVFVKDGKYKKCRYCNARSELEELK